MDHLEAQRSERDTIVLALLNERPKAERTAASKGKGRPAEADQLPVAAPPKARPTAKAEPVARED